jgi:hypothetical protein
MRTNVEYGFPYFLVGMSLGVIGGLLLASRPGEETRKYIRERSNKSLDYVNEQAAKLRRAAGVLVETGKKLMACQRQPGDTEAERQAYEEEKRETLGG